MIRSMTPTDTQSMVQLAVDAEMFPPEAGSFLEAQAAGWFEQGQKPGTWVVDERDGAVVGVAFFEPRDATDRVWYLTMIAVSPRVQGQGVGRGLLQHVEEVLRASEQRLLLVETSGTAQYDGTRHFYGQCGYGEVARVPHYFEDGDDMVLFLKDLRDR